MSSSIVVAFVIIFLGENEATAAPICTPDMEPLKCGEAQLAEAASLLGEYKHEIARLEAQISTLRTQQPNVEIKIGDLTFAKKLAEPDKNWIVTGDCPSGYKVVSYYCQINNGGGNLQNIGITSDSNYQCLWNSVSGPFAAWGRPVCLKVTQ
jgi:hypothetical protein